MRGRLLLRSPSLCPAMRITKAVAFVGVPVVVMAVAVGVGVGVVRTLDGREPEHPAVEAVPVSEMVRAIVAEYRQTGYDASAHISEETKGAALGAAKGVWRSVFWAGVIGWFVLLANARTTALAGSAGGPITLLLVILCAAMGWLGELFVMRLHAAQHLRRRYRRAVRRYTKCIKEVEENQQHIIKIERSGRKYADQAARITAAHAISRDHAQPRNHAEQ